MDGIVVFEESIKLIPDDGRTVVFFEKRDKPPKFEMISETEKIKLEKVTSKRVQCTVHTVYKDNAKIRIVIQNKMLDQIFTDYQNQILQLHKREERLASNYSVCVYRAAVSDRKYQDLKSNWWVKLFIKLRFIKE